jgi:phytoene synthase
MDDDRWSFPNRATPPGSSAYYSIRVAPAVQRDALAALFGWRERVRAVLDEVSDPGVARLKLDWWRAEIERTLGGSPRHPVSRALAATTRGLPPEPFHAIADQAEAELRGIRNPDFDGQRQRAERDLGAVFELILRLDDVVDPGRLDQSRQAGAWCWLVRRWRDGGALLRCDREVLPDRPLEAVGLTQARLARQSQRHRLPGLLADLAPEVRHRRPDTTGLPRVLAAQIRIHAALLDELIRDGFPVVDQRIGLTPLRKLWLAWRSR